MANADTAEKTPPSAIARNNDFEVDRHAATIDIQRRLLSEIQQINELNRKIHGQPPLKSKELWNFLLQFFGLLAAFLFGIFAILAWKEADRANKVAAVATDLASSANVLASSANAMASSGNRVAVTARADAAVANMLAIWARCEATPTGEPTALTTSTRDPCVQVLSVMAESNAFYLLANQYFTLETFSANDATTTSTSRDDDPTPTSTSGPPTAPSNGRSASSAGIIAGAVIGGLAGCGLLFGIAYLPYQTYRAKMKRSQDLAATWRGEKVEGKNA